MNVQPTGTPDLVSAAVFFATALFGGEVAAVVGPYSIILLFAMLGAGWSVSALPSKPTRLAAIGLFAGIVLFALGVTVPLSELTSSYLPSLKPSVIFGPMAALIGGIGPNWPKVGRWVIGFVADLVRSRAGLPPPPPGGAQ